MADSQKRSGVINDRKTMREAFLMALMPDDIREMVLGTLDIATSEKASNKDRLTATRLILDFAVSKPTSEIDITSDGDRITGYTFEVIRSNEKED
jgi:hypothetical protein